MQKNDFKVKKLAKIFLARPLPSARAKGSEEKASGAAEQYELPIFMSRVILYVLAGFFCVGLLWAALSRVDIVVSAKGQLRPQGKVKVVQPAANGVIERLFVHEGQKVGAGTKLLLLERTPYESELNKETKELEMATSELEQFKEAQAALEQIIANPAVVPPKKVDVSNIGKLIGDVYSAFIAMQEAGVDYSGSGQSSAASSSDMVALRLRLERLEAQETLQKSILENRRKEYADKKNANTLEIEKLSKALQHAKVELQTVNSLLVKSEEKEQAYKKVFEQGAVSRVAYLDVAKEVEQERRSAQKQEAEISSLTKRLEIAKSRQKQFGPKSAADLAQIDAEIKHLGEQVATVEMQVRSNQRRYSLAKASFDAAMASARAALEKIDADIDQKTRRVSQAESSVRKAQKAYDEAEIKAPIAGIVTGILARGRGQVVTHGEPLMSVVPENTTLVVEARVSNKDIGFIETGQTVKLKFEAFPHHEYGVVRGKVIEIEKHAAEDPKLGSIYKVLIAPERNWIKAKGRKFQFNSGLAVTSEIIVRKRSILDIFLEPIKKLKDTQWV